MTVRYIEEEVVPGKRLGRHVNHDVRSLGFLFAAEPREVVPVAWTRQIPTLDQGSLGSCTGNALTGAVGTYPLFPALPASHPALDENEAVSLYSLATQLDPYAGQYPPTDTGSDGVSVCKAGVRKGLISGYTHCTDLASMQQALQRGPVIVGVNWYSSFDTPDSSGLVSISSGAYVRGGHEFEVYADNANGTFYAWNSWGNSYGVGGKFHFSYDTMSRLFSEQGDCTVPAPLSAPRPAPSPVLYTCDGTLSLVGVSAKFGSPVSTILRTTLQQYKLFSSAMSHYLQHGDLTLPVPSGEKLCLAWPQYHIS